MTEAVQRTAGLAVENLVSTGERMTKEAIAAEQELLSDFAALLTSLNSELSDDTPHQPEAQVLKLRFFRVRLQYRKEAPPQL